MDSFDQILKRVMGSEKLDNVPALFIVNIIIVLDEMGYLKEDIYVSE